MLLMFIASVIWGTSQPTVAALNSVPLHRRVNKSSHLTVPDTLHDHLPKIEIWMHTTRNVNMLPSSGISVSM